MSDTPDRASGPDFPCADLDSALIQLRRPPSPAAVRFKIQNRAERAAQIAAYLDARFVYDRLDRVCGRRWKADFGPLAPALVPAAVDDDGVPIARPPLYVRCSLTVCGVTRQDVGEGADPKAAWSDSVKRAGVQFGVGRALYAMRAPWLLAGEADRELRRNGRGRLILDERSEAWCREQYERWLGHRGAALYGEPLDHGDTVAAAAQRPVAETPGARGSEDQPGALARELRPVPNAQDDPADSERGIAYWQRRGHYGDGTVATLARLACGAEWPSELDAAQTARLAWQLELAVKAALPDAKLAGEVKTALAEDDRERALQAFTATRIRQAREAGLVGRRAERRAA